MSESEQKSARVCRAEPVPRACVSLPVSLYVCVLICAGVGVTLPASRLEMTKQQRQWQQEK